MNRLYIIAIFLLGMSNGYGQCPTADIVLNTQEDVDNFVLDYPGCTELLEDLIIDGNAIENLKGLGAIESVEGSLRIVNTSLTNLMGLDQLQSVGGEFQLQNNNLLIDLEGLFSLNSVLRLFILSNESLQSLDGLDVLTTIEVPESVVIVNNNSLVSINALSTLVNCPSCWIDISFNDNLTNLGGLESIPATDIGFLALLNNPMLVTCNLPNICEYLANDGLHEIENNASGCESQSDIISNCIFSVSDNEMNSSLYLLPNPVLETLRIRTFGNIRLLRTQVYSLIGEQILETSEEQINVQSLATGIYFVEVQTDRGVVVRKIVKE